MWATWPGKGWTCWTRRTSWVKTMETKGKWVTRGPIWVRGASSERRVWSRSSCVQGAAGCGAAVVGLRLRRGEAIACFFGRSAPTFQLPGSLSLSNADLYRDGCGYVLGTGQERTIRVNAFTAGCTGATGRENDCAPPSFLFSQPSPRSIPTYAFTPSAPILPFLAVPSASVEYPRLVPVPRSSDIADERKRGLVGA